MSYTKKDISDAIKRPPRTINLWTDSGLVIPDIRGSEGRGFARLYSERNLIEFGMVDILSRVYGVCMDMVGVILRCIRRGEFIYEYPGQPTYKVHFKDFYSSSSWGNKKELLFVTNRVSPFGKDGGVNGPVWFDAVNIENGKLADIGDALKRSGQKDNPMVIVIRLALIKETVKKAM